MRSLASLLIFFLISTGSQAKLLDKVLAVVNDQVITLSMVKRISQNLVARQNILSQVYQKDEYTSKELVELEVQRIMIKEKLKEVGYEVGDDEVEAQIKQTEKSVNLTRERLLAFLKANNMTFDEYFEITRQGLELNFFNSRIIRPLVSVSDLDVKNEFFRRNSENQTLALKYTLVDFTIAKDLVSKEKVKKFPKALVKFQSSGVIEKSFSKLETNVLSDITEDGLTPTLAKVFKKTDEGQFTPPILLGDYYHVFFVKKKDLVESQTFAEVKNQLKAELYIKTAAQIMKVWFEREESKHYIKYF